MIKVTDIHKRFGDLEVLKGVSLDVAEGVALCASLTAVRP